MDTGAWQATVHGVEKSWTQLSNFHFHKEPWVFPGGADGKESACNVGDLGWEDPLEKGKATTPVFWRIPRTVSSMSHKESDTTE